MSITVPICAVDKVDPLDLLATYNTPIIGKFTQKKYFKILKKPVRSSGIFSATKDGFNWQITTPVPSAVILQGENLYLENSRGDRESQPNAHSFITILKAILIGDKSTIRAYFDVDQGDINTCASLVPNLALMRKVLTRLDICQRTDGYEIELFDSNDVRTIITLAIQSDSK